MNPTAILIALVLFGGALWKAYHAGGTSARLELAEFRATANEAGRIAERAERSKETRANTELGRIRDEITRQKTARDLATKLADDRLRDLDAALASSRTTGQDSSTTSGTDDPRSAIIGECSRVVIELDAANKRLVDKTAGLQDFARLVCMSQGLP